MTPFTHGLSAVDYCGIVETIFSATSLLIEGGRNPDCDSAVAVIAKTGMLTADDLNTIHAVCTELFSRVIH